MAMLRVVLSLAIFATAAAVAAEGSTSQHEDMPISLLKSELIGLEPIKTPSSSTTPTFVFLQKFPLTGGLFFHTEVLVCRRSTFSTNDQNFLDNKISSMKDFAELDNSWWSTKTNDCVELGYGGAGCSEECCGAPHGEGQIHFSLNEKRAVISNIDPEQKTLFLYGHGDFDGNVAFHHTCDHKCWSNWAGTDYNPLTNNCNTFTSTVLHCVYGLSEKKPNLGVSDMVTVKCQSLCEGSFGLKASWARRNE